VFFFTLEKTLNLFTTSILFFFMIFDHTEWAPIAEIIDKSQTLIRSLLEKHTQTTDHDDKRQSLEMQWFLNVFRFISRKWNADILYQLHIHTALTFNELRRHLNNLSSRTLSDCLKQLQEYKLITRELQDTRPPSVRYSLSQGGKGFIELSMLLVFYLAETKSKP
jgi:DNA-binding HxlR family transcriptional regulator